MTGEGLFRKLVKRGGRDWIILIFSLFLAFFMWSIQKFSQDYSAYIQYKISLNSPMEGRVQNALSENLLVVRGKSSGFYILQHKYSGEDAQVLNLSAEQKQLRRIVGSPDKYYVLSSDIKSKIQEALGDEFQLESFTTDTLYFNFPKQSYKKVPITSRQSLRYKAQYMPFTPVVLKPDSVLIYGQTALLKKVDSVSTELIKRDKLSEPVNGMISLAPIEGIRFSADEVYYSQEIGRYVENRVSVNVGVMNAPSDKNVVVIPQEVRLSFRSPFPGKGKMSEGDFSVSVDYADVEEGGRVRPVLLKKPAAAHAVQIEPRFVECIVNEF